MTDATGIEHLEFLGDDKAVRGDIVPVDERNRRRVFLAIDELGLRYAECEFVVKTFIGRQEALIEPGRGEISDNIFDRA